MSGSVIAELVRDPDARHDQGEREQTEGPGGGPAPFAPLTEHHRHSDHRGAESGHAEVIEPSRAAIGVRGEHHDDQEQRQGDRDRTEPERSAIVVELRDQGGDRVPQSRADRRAHGKGCHGACRLVGCELAPCDRHGHREQAEADPLQASSQSQHGKAGGQCREHAPGEDGGEGEHDDPALSGSVRQAAHGGRGQGP